MSSHGPAFPLPLFPYLSDNIDILMVRQKKKAIQYWKKSNFDEALKKQVHGDVMRNLNKGKVLPIFHPLCRPPNKRLFQPEQRVSVEDANLDMIQLSATHVTMGKSNSEKESVGEISSRREASYIPAFFKEDFGFFEVKDFACSWKYSDYYTKMVTDLVNAPAEMKGEDIEVTELSEPLAHIDCARNLITRRLSRGVVADCFDKSKRGSTYAITGNPGIGKSWTLIYALQQALLYENACVLLCFQTDTGSTAIVCIRRNDKMYAWSCNHSLFGDNLDSNLFQNSNVLALLDPCESKIDGAAYSEGRRMLIMAALNNAKHFYSTGSIKSTPDMLRLLSTPTMMELVVSVRYMLVGPPMSADVRKRVYTVGLLPRYITSNYIFQRRLTDIEEATKNLLKVRAMISGDGLITNESSLPGCVFTVNVMLGSNINLDGAPSSDQSDEIESDDDSVRSVGYDGERIIDYGERKISIMSPFVLSKIEKSDRATILAYWDACY